jgi:hypothetical protein
MTAEIRGAVDSGRKQYIAPSFSERRCIASPAARMRQCFAPSNLRWLLARCASAHHQGLEQTFNSLDAQREASWRGSLSTRGSIASRCPSIFHSFNCWMIAHLSEKLLACATPPGLSRQEVCTIKSQEIAPSSSWHRASDLRNKASETMPLNSY